MSGLSPDGGLYLPQSIPRLAGNKIEALQGLTFQELSFEIASLWLQHEVSIQTLHKIIDTAFSFDVPLLHVKDGIYSLELFHGPTLHSKILARGLWPSSWAISAARLHMNERSWSQRRAIQEAQLRTAFIKLKEPE